MEQSNKSPRAARFNLELRGDRDMKEKLHEKIKTAKIVIQKLSAKNIQNFEVLDHALDKFLGSVNSVDIEAKPQSFVQLDREKCMSEKIFMTSKTSIERCFEIGQQHGYFCKKSLEIIREKQLGHATLCEAKCADGHMYRWTSSSYIAGTSNYLVNQRIAFGYQTSGLLPSQYERFVEAANMGSLSFHKRNLFSQDFEKCINLEYNKCIESARFEEMAFSSIESDTQQPITILTDARHGWRKNTHDSSVVAIGEITHKVLACEHITKNDNPIPQKHELIGCKRIAESLDKDDIEVGVWVHDCNTTIDKYVTQLQDVTNQNETWHGIKNLKKEISKVVSGAKTNEGKTWHRQLCDKVLPIATHAQYSMRNCGGDAQRLRDQLDNIVEHYQGNHEQCPSTSRCKTDPNYEPGHVIITDKKAVTLLKQAIQRSIIYKRPRNFCLAKDTYYVESFNNAILKFLDKRIAFSSREYGIRSKLAVLHWNENVDKEHTSEYRTKNSRKISKTLKNTTHNYRLKLWNSFIS